MLLKSFLFQIFFLFLICFRLIISTEIYKCCPEGYHLSLVNENPSYECIQSQNLNLNLQFYSYDVISNYTKNNMIPENCETTVLKISDKSVSMSESGCVDFDIDKQEFIIIQCKSDYNNLINIGKFHKCCPKNYVFNNNSNECVKGSSDDINFFSNLLNKNISVFTTGPPKCESVVVNYLSLKQDMYLKDLNVIVDGKLEFTSGIKSFCIDSTIDHKWFIQACHSYSICNKIPCVQKCCNLGMIYERKDRSKPTCIESFSRKILEFHNIDDFIPEKHIIPEKMNVPASGSYFKDCEKKSVVDSEHYFDYKSTYLWANAQTYENYDYCIESVDYGSNIPRQDLTFICLHDQTTKNIIFGILTIFSCIGLGLTIIVYIILPKLWNLHGKIVLGSLSSLFLAYSFLAYSKLAHISHDSPRKPIAYIIYFSFISSFSWLNIMCFDMFVKIRSITPKIGTNTKAKEWRRFLLYCLYSIVFPLCMTFLVLTIDSYKLLSGSYLPKLGEGDTFWFPNHYRNNGYKIFFSMIVGIQVMINVVLFVFTAYYCNRVKNEINSRTSTERKKKRFIKDLDKFKLIMKFFVVMGISWSLEILSSLFYKYPNYFYFTDVYNSLQGCAIFVIFVCKKTIIDNLKNRFGYKTRRPGETSLNTNTSVISTSTTRGGSECFDTSSKRLSKNDNRASNNKEHIPLTQITEN